jgi:hypothetical protein
VGTGAATASRADGGQTHLASLCVAAGIKPIDIAELMGHRDIKTTLTVCAHLINIDDHAGNMAALGAIATPPKVEADNVVALRR